MTPFATMTPDQRTVFLAALKGVVANPKLMGSTRKVAASKAVRLAEAVAKESA